MADYGIVFSDEENVDILEKYEELRDMVDEMRNDPPEALPRKNFVGYYSFRGKIDDYESYVVYDVRGKLKAFRVTLHDKKSEISAGELRDESSFIEDLSGLTHVELNKGELQNIEQNYGLLIYRQGDDVVGCLTTNLF